MKHLFRYLSVVAMLLTSMTVSAQSTIRVMEVNNGTVVADKSSASKDETVTLTVTPSDGYYFQKKNLEVVKTINPNFSRTRGEIQIPVSGSISVSGSDPEDLSTSRQYTFVVPDDGYEIQVSATFTARSLGPQAALHVATAGGLSSLISDENKYTIESLTITGQLNGNDLALLRDMAGNDMNGHVTEGKLKTLDLSDANIESGGTYVDFTEGKYYIDSEQSVGVGGIKSYESVANEFKNFLFAGCGSLETIYLPNSLSRISASSTFTDCKKLTTVYIPASVGYMDNTFISCPSLTSIIIDPDNVRYESPNNKVIIDKETHSLITGCKDAIIPANMGIISISKYAFLGHCDLTSIEIPAGVTSIGTYAFASTSISSVVLPSTINTIDERAFEVCNNLNTVTIGVTDPSTITVGSNAFKNSQIDLIVPAGSVSAYKAADFWKDFKTIKDINGNTVDNERTINVATAGELSSLISAEEKYGIEELTVTGSLNGVDLRFLREMAGCDYNGVPTDGKLSYLDMSGATIVAGGNYVKLTDGYIYLNKEKTSYTGTFTKTAQKSKANSLGNYVFAGCSKLETVKLPSGLVTIGDRAFALTSLKSIVWPTSLTSIDSKAFMSCKFKSFTLPESVESLGSNILLSCSSLTSLSVASGNKVYDSRSKCKAIIKTSTNELVCGSKNAVIPSTVTSIGDGAFSGLGLTSISIPSGVTSIENGAFAGNNLTSVIIPASVTSIGSSFYENNLESVTVEWTSPIAISSNTFSNQGNATLNVPAGSLSAYKAAAYWKQFKKIVEVASKVKLNKSKLTLEKGKTEVLTPTVSPSTLSDKSVTWESSNTKIATVTSGGKVKGVKAGTATITCTSVMTGAKATCKVTVGYVSLDKSEAVIKKGKTVVLTPTVYPSTLSDKSVTWESSDTKIATVTSDGTVKGVKYGTATITCTSVATGLSATCEVTVGKVVLNETEVSIQKGKTVVLTPTVYPTTLSDKSVTWESSDTKIATVTTSGKVKGVTKIATVTTSGKVKGVKYGTATITCTSVATGLSATCKVTVGGVRLDKSEAVIKKGKTVVLTPTVYPTTLSDKSVTWESSDTKIATVTSDGTVKGVKYGTATITCTSVATGFFATCEVTVGKVVLNETEVSIQKGKTVVLTPTVRRSPR